jgi:amino acid transporter
LSAQQVEKASYGLLERECLEQSGSACKPMFGSSSKLYKDAARSTRGEGLGIGNNEVLMWLAGEAVTSTCLGEDPMLTKSREPVSTQPKHVTRPLYSQKYIPRVMPPLLGSFDLTSLFLLNVFWVTNCTPIASGGLASFTYWIIGGLLFFLPVSLVTAQLAILYPHAGGLYNWTYHALGSGMSFFVGVCAWLPVILSMVNASAALVSCIQALNANWVTLPWQQGLVILAVLAFVGIFSCQRTRTVQHVLNFAAGAMGLATVLITAAALAWLLKGHPSATNFANATGWSIQLGPQSNLALLGSVLLALMGGDMPLTLGGEIKGKKVIGRHLAWGTLLTLGGYLVFTFAILVVQGANTALNTSNPLALLIDTVDGTLGKSLGDVMGVCLLFYFLMIPVALNICCARLFMGAALDQRIPTRFARLNRSRVPSPALVTQTLVAAFFTLLIYFVAPSITVLGKPADVNSEVYNVLGASLLLVWAVSFLFLFVDVAVLYFRYPQAFRQHRVVPLPVLTISVIVGTLLCAATMVSTLFNSFIPQLIPNATWWYVVGGAAVAWIVICALGSMFANSEANWEALQQSTQSTSR